MRGGRIREGPVRIAQRRSGRPYLTTFATPAPLASELPESGGGGRSDHIPYIRKRGSDRPGRATVSDGGSRGSRTRWSRGRPPCRGIPRRHCQLGCEGTDSGSHRVKGRAAKTAIPLRDGKGPKGGRATLPTTLGSIGNVDPGPLRSYESDSHLATLVGVQGWSDLISKAQGPKTVLPRFASHPRPSVGPLPTSAGPIALERAVRYGATGFLRLRGIEIRVEMY
jgi:hypothetical protein